MLIGNVGKDPEVHYFEADQAIAKVSLATTERGYTLPNGTQVPDRTDWHYLMFSRRLAKIVEQYVHKGDKIYVEGRLRNRSYDDKRGIRHQYGTSHSTLIISDTKSGSATASNVATVTAATATAGVGPQ